MSRLIWLIVLPLSLLACDGPGEPGGPSDPGEAAAEATADFAQPRSTLAQLMRGLLYPNSEIIFAAQNEDPEAAAAAAASAEPFGNTDLYGGWEGVENAALVLSEAANLIMIPGRSCENGLPVPLTNEDFQMYARQLIDAGRAAYEAAQTKNVDAMLEASGVVSDACSVCHETYRDREEQGVMRCTVGAP